MCGLCVAISVPTAGCVNTTWVGVCVCVEGENVGLRAVCDSGTTEGYMSVCGHVVVCLYNLGQGGRREWLLCVVKAGCGLCMGLRVIVCL